MVRTFTEKSDVKEERIQKRGGFASEKIGKDGLTGLERARLAGAKGGRISRRKPRNGQEIAKRATSASKLYTILQDYITTPNKGAKNDQ